MLSGFGIQKGYKEQKNNGKQKKDLIGSEGQIFITFEGISIVP